MRLWTATMKDVLRWAPPAPVCLLALIALPQPALAQYYLRPFGHMFHQMFHPPGEDEPRFSSRRAVAAIVAHEGYRLTGPLGERGDQIIATGVDERGRRMRFVVDPYEGEVLGSQPMAAPRRDERIDEAAPVGRKPNIIGAQGGGPARAETAPKIAPVAKAETATKTAPVTKPETAPKIAPVAKAETAPKIAPVAKAETATKTAPVAKPETAAKAAPVAKAETATKTAPVAKPATKAETAVKTAMRPEPRPATRAEGRTSAAPGSSHRAIAPPRAASTTATVAPVISPAMPPPATSPATSPVMPPAPSAAPAAANTPATSPATVVEVRSILPPIAANSPLLDVTHAESSARRLLFEKMRETAPGG